MHSESTFAARRRVSSTRHETHKRYWDAASRNPEPWVVASWKHRVAQDKAAWHDDAAAFGAHCDGTCSANLGTCKGGRRCAKSNVSSTTLSCPESFYTISPCHHLCVAHTLHHNALHAPSCCLHYAATPACDCTCGVCCASRCWCQVRACVPTTTLEVAFSHQVVCPRQSFNRLLSSKRTGRKV